MILLEFFIAHVWSAAFWHNFALIFFVIYTSFAYFKFIEEITNFQNLTYMNFKNTC